MQSGETNNSFRPYIDDGLLPALDRFAEKHFCKNRTTAVNMALAKVLEGYLESPAVEEKGDDVVIPLPKEPTTPVEPVVKEVAKPKVSKPESIEIGDVLGGLKGVGDDWD